jgi:iron complex transport system substrate-binding protein
MMDNFVKRSINRPPIWGLILIMLTLGMAVGGCATAAAPAEGERPPVTAAPLPTQTESLPIPTEETLLVVDGLGRSVTFQEPPQRIISMAPSNTEMLFAIGAAEQVVGRDDYSDFPPEALEVASIGATYGELNTEAIIALEPDLILVAEITPIEQIEALTALGLAVFQVPNPMSFEDLFINLETIGMIAGHQQTAAELIDALAARVEAVGVAVADAPTVRVFYEVDGTDPTAPWTTGADTFQQVLIEMVKGENTAADLEGWGSMNLEQIVERDPEVIIYGEGPWVPTTSESLAQRSGWGAISAVLDGRVHGVDTNWIDRPGPRLVDALERFAQVIHPELFE